jgi:hypothetical protein
LPAAARRGTNAAMTDTAHFFERGWTAFPADPALTRWLAASAPAARATIRDPAHAEWLRCDGTWFVGVNVLENDETGAVAGGPPVAGAAVDFIARRLGLSAFAWDRAQISVCFPGYPRQGDEEDDKAFAYRRNRDAAHVDGLLKEGPARRRFVREFHAFVLGIPITDHDADASPLVIWEGSHDIVRRAFAERFAGLDPAAWVDEDVTEAYHAARRTAFETCRRVAIHAKPGESYLLHRLSLHGMAPWRDGAQADPHDGRAIAYFRPGILSPEEWLTAP